jgi:phosphate transport system permease protein
MSRATYRRTANGVFVFLCGLATLVALAFLIMILWTLFSKGIGGFDLKIFTMDQPPPGSDGGLRNAIVGSLIMCAIGMAIALVIGILAGTWLAEYGAGTRYGNVIRFLNDVLISAPSILIGLFVYELLVAPFHGFSALAGAVALAFLATPIVVRTTEDGMALGASRAFVIRRIIWKSARSGLLTAGLLGFARISGETAPLLFTSLGNLNNNYNHLTQPMASLPTTIFQFALSAYDDWQRLAWVGALLIALTVLAINIIGRLLARESRP